MPTKTIADAVRKSAKAWSAHGGGSDNWAEVIRRVRGIVAQPWTFANWVLRKPCISEWVRATRSCSSAGAERSMHVSQFQLIAVTAPSARRSPNA